MSLEKLENYLNKTEAITQYDQVNKENKQLKSRLSEAREQLSKYETMAIKLDGRKVSLETLLKKTEEHASEFLREEIERKAQEKFEAEADELARKEMQRILKLPYCEMPKDLSDLLEKKVEERTNLILNTPSLWPSWFNHLQQQHIIRGIKAGLDEIFQRNIQAAINKAKQEEWPKFLDKYIREVITPFCKREIISQIMKPTIIQKNCDKCGIENTWELLPEHITELIKQDYILVNCQNPQCRDIFVRHKIAVTLGDLVSNVLGLPHHY